MIRKCLRCKIDFQVEPYKIREGKGKYCSRDCAYPPIKRNCLRCKKGYRISPITRINGYGKYCSNECKNVPTIYKCLVCNKEILDRPSHKRKCCSRQCKSVYMKIMKYSYWKGKKRLSMMRDNNWKWKGGITPLQTYFRNSLEYKQWRNKVFQRDLYTCQRCNQTGIYLHADHIKSFSESPEFRLEVSNGITLCVPCHYYKTFGREMPLGNKWGHNNYKIENTEYA